MYEIFFPDFPVCYVQTPDKVISSCIFVDKETTPLLELLQNKTEYRYLTFLLLQKI